MAYDLGSTVPLTTEILDESGALTAAFGVTCTVTYRLPDGTTVAVQPPVLNPSLGRYTADFVPVTDGPHTERWTSTSPATARSDAFDVRAAAPGYIIGLDDAKAHLNKEAPEDDEELRPYLLTAADVIEERQGEVLVPRTVVDPIRVVSYPTAALALCRTPVLSVTSLVAIDGTLTWRPADLVADASTGLLHVARGPLLHGVLRATYVAGYLRLPERYRMAARMILSALWASQRPDTGARRPQLGAGGQVLHSSGRRYQAADFPEAERLLGLGGAGFA